ncbi:hypothetical protein Bca52824_090606 [Brassica carinata]|uniref:Reverse transcriptase n=1 Tax=Brassica carinata TaxID=52824 RepID=A0A8X7NXS1_BRACI|nr:hypothetical protein Bca52824_090606 [Brassica carinata]
MYCCFIQVKKMAICKISEAINEIRELTLKIRHGCSRTTGTNKNLFMCKAYLAQATVLHRVLEFYGEATGQCINLLKSSISFGDKVDVQTRLLHLSQGGKEILLKSTAGAIPVSAMGCFKLPKSILSKLATMMANYWWSSEPHHRKMHWISWDKMCLPKSLGGMGFKDLECFNQAMLAKQAEKILNNPHCLLARFLKSIYFVDGDFLSAPLGVRSSYAWRSLLFGRDLLQKGLKLRVGNGQRTRVWLDKWVEDPIVGLRAPWIKNNTFDVNLRAEYLIDFEERIWNQHKLRELFVQGDVDIISRCQPVCHRDDFFTWNYNKNGRISVKSAYWLASMEKFKIHHSRSFELWRSWPWIVWNLWKRRNELLFRGEDFRWRKW